MKTLVVVICLVTASAFAQSGSGAVVLNSEPQPITVSSHPRSASTQSLASTQNLLGSAGYASARGERPLWEVVTPRVEVPLGDIARNLKKEKAEVKKAAVVHEN